LAHKYIVILLWKQLMLALCNEDVCVTNYDGFALALSATIEDADPLTTIEVASVLYSAELLTDLTCMWDTKFVVTMPSLLTPAAPGEKYSFTGPTLKTTVTLDGAPA
jgi:hypothetical protein